MNGTAVAGLEATRDFAPPCTGGDAGGGAESSREVALFGKARIQRDLGETIAAIRKQSLGALDPRVQMPEMRRASRGDLESSAELRGRQVCEARQFG